MKCEQERRQTSFLVRPSLRLFSFPSVPTHSLQVSGWNFKENSKSSLNTVIFSKININWGERKGSVTFTCFSQASIGKGKLAKKSFEIFWINCTSQKAKTFSYFSRYYDSFCISASWNNKPSSNSFLFTKLHKCLSSSCHTPPSKLAGSSEIFSTNIENAPSRRKQSSLSFWLWSYTTNILSFFLNKYIWIKFSSQITNELFSCFILEGRSGMIVDMAQANSFHQQMPVVLYFLFTY